MILTSYLTGFICNVLIVSSTDRTRDNNLILEKFKGTGRLLNQRKISCGMNEMVVTKMKSKGPNRPRPRVRGLASPQLLPRRKQKLVSLAAESYHDTPSPKP